MEIANQPTCTEAADTPTRVDAWLGFAVLVQGFLLASLNLDTIVQARTQLEIALHMKVKEAYQNWLRTVGSEPSPVDWSTVGYALLFVLVMPTCVLLVRAFGYRGTCILAMLMFTIGSLGVSLTGNLNNDLVWLFWWRIAQATGGGAMLPLAGALIKYLYPSRHYNVNFQLPGDARIELTNIMLYVAALISIMLSSSYTAKLIESSVDWGWVPLLNVFFGLGAMVLIVNLPLDVSPYEVTLNWSAWLLLGFSVFAFSITLSLSTMTGRPGFVMPTDGCTDLCSYVWRHLL